MGSGASKTLETVPLAAEVKAEGKAEAVDAKVEAKAKEKRSNLGFSNLRAEAKQVKSTVDTKEAADSDSDDDFDDDFSGTVVDFLDSTIVADTSSTASLTIDTTDNGGSAKAKLTPSSGSGSPSHNPNTTVETTQLQKKKLVLEYICVNNYLVGSIAVCHFLTYFTLHAACNVS